ncbi:MAG: alpha-amylase family glycosyl hydrolase [Alphaproteobacteria bacterium]
MGQGQGPRIYNLFPLLCGSVPQWEEHLPRIADMGFNWIYLNPFHYPGFSGSLYAVKDYYRIHDRMWDGSDRGLRELLSAFTWRAGELGLSVIMDLVINHTSKDAVLAEQHPDWFMHEADGSLHSPRAIDPADSRKVTVWGDLAEIEYRNPSTRAAMTSYWGELIGFAIDCGIRGFRCDAAYQVPAEVWSHLTRFARFKRKDAAFFAETLGCRLEQVEALRSAGFDYLFNSAKWWDFKSPWLLEQYESFRRIAPSVAFPESHDTDRLAHELEALGHPADPGRIERLYRQRYLFATVFSTGVMMPVGYEYGFRRKLNVVTTTSADWETPLFDISGYVSAVNRMKAEHPVFNEEGPTRHIPLADAKVTGLLRTTRNGGFALTLINTDPDRTHGARLEQLGAEVGTCREITPDREPQTVSVGDMVMLSPSEARVFVNM